MNNKDIRTKEYLGIARLMEFEIDQWIAIINKEEISYETYKECLDICMKIDDTSTFCKLVENYPEHSERHEKEMESELEEVKLSEEESNIIWKKILEDIQKIKD